MRKIVIVGDGNIGSQVAYTLYLKNNVDELVIVDRNKEKSLGDVIDLEHGLSLVGDIKCVNGEYSDCKDASLIIMTLSISSKGLTNRTDLLEGNLHLFKEVLSQIKPHINENTKFLIISNPCDVLAYFTMKFLNLNPNNVFSAGTVLDSSRFVYFLDQLDATNSHTSKGMIIGEHGETSVPLYSEATIGEIPFYEYVDKNGQQIDTIDMQRYMNNSGFEITQKKGSTNFATAVAVNKIVENLLNRKEDVLPMSVYMKDSPYFAGEYFMSLPVKYVENKVIFTEFGFDEKEKKFLNKSKASLIGFCQICDKFIADNK